MKEELAFQVALELIPGVGNKGVKALIAYSGSASAVFKQTKSRLLKIPGVGEKMATVIASSDPLKQAEEVIRSAEKINADILHFTHPSYPQRLKHATDAPNILFKKGNGDLNPRRCLAIVGTRKATAYGKRLTDAVVKELAALNVEVVSGLAYGIDVQAHRACLQNNIPTHAVLAGGLDHIYPSLHKKYAEALLDTGTLVSECLPGTTPDPHLFPARNRIIAGMTDATLVVEAAAKGGALITAHIADSYNRPVFAVPGEVGRPYSEGTNRLIASQRALIFTHVDDLMYHLNWDAEAEKSAERVVPDLTKKEEVIYSLLSTSNDPMEIDLIAVKSQISINQVASLLLSLEFKNLVKSLPGKKFGIL